MKRIKRSRFDRNLVLLRKDFLRDCERLIQGEIVEFYYHPLILCLIARIPRRRRAELRIKSPLAKLL
jgi:hypothetical protein